MHTPHTLSWAQCLKSRFVMYLRIFCTLLSLRIHRLKAKPVFGIDEYCWTNNRPVTRTLFEQGQNQLIFPWQSLFCNCETFIGKIGQLLYDVWTVDGDSYKVWFVNCNPVLARFFDNEKLSTCLRLTRILSFFLQWLARGVCYSSRIQSQYYHSHTKSEHTEDCLSKDLIYRFIQHHNILTLLSFFHISDGFKKRWLFTVCQVPE